MTNVDLTKLTLEQLEAIKIVIPQASEEIEKRMKASEAEFFYDMKNPKLYYADMYNSIQMLKPFFEGRTNQVRKALEESRIVEVMEKLLRTNEKLSKESGKPLVGSECFAEIYGDQVASSEPQVEEVPVEIIDTEENVEASPVEVEAPAPASNGGGFDMAAILAKANQVKAAQG